jgi:hypothetical protein
VDTPTPDEVRPRSELLTARYPDDDGGPNDLKLKALLDDDAPVVSSLTGRIIGPEGTPGEEVPAWLVPVAMRVMALRAERMSVTGTARARTGVLGSLRLRSFSAGPYSESYFGPGEAATAKVLDPDPAVHELLWALATEEMRRYWLRLWGLGVEDPAVAVQSFEWGARHVRRAPPFG